MVMAINFPNDSATGATYNYAGLNYTYDGLRWVGKLAVVGSTGNQGSTGAQAAVGQTGAQGSTGTQGSAGNQGSTGTQGSAGNQGSTGTQGSAGNQGIQGAQGVQGSIGAQGYQGAQGVQGIQGATGSLNVTSTSPVSTDNTDPFNPVISMAQSDATNDGFLSSVDWNTFNNKGSSNFGGIPAWTSAGAITITATTTNPTKGTTTSDNISYRQLGAKQWEIILTYIQTVANGVGGSGDYLVTLPNSLSFDTTLPSQQITTTNIGTNTYALMTYIIPSGSGLINSDSLGGQVYPIVYSATKFRILTTSYNSAIQCWGSGYYALGVDDPKIQLTFRFTST